MKKIFHKNDTISLHTSRALQVSVSIVLAIGISIVLQSFSPLSQSSWSAQDAYLDQQIDVSVPDTGDTDCSIKTVIIDSEDKTEKDIKLILKNGEVTELFIDGRRVPENEIKNHHKLIASAIKEKDQAIKELEEMDFEDIEKEVAKALKELEEINFGEIAVDVAGAIKDLTFCVPPVHCGITAPCIPDIDELLDGFGTAIHIGIEDLEDIQKDAEEVIMDIEVIMDGDNKRKKTDKELEDLLEEIEED